MGLEASGHFEVVWSNQWEPSTKAQHASMVYEARFGPKGHSNADIASVPSMEIPDADVLVGGFPCQDYSVASTLQNAKGLIGKKGVLWWSIHKILSEKKQPPKYLFLENVDRLLKSPSNQRGRDFAIMLKSLDELGYAVEWRVINAADYGMPQRRRRIFFIGYHKTTPAYKVLKKADAAEWVYSLGTFAKAFPVAQEMTHSKKGVHTAFEIKDNLVDLSETFNVGQRGSPFENSGVFINGKVHTQKTVPAYDGERTVLKDILVASEVPGAFYIPEEALAQWEYLKGGKKETRTAKNGYTYQYSEGSMVFPDAIDCPSRTIITGEGGSSPSRFKHVVATNKGLRRLTPIELERLNMFPDNHTQLNGISDTKRAFFMGNALVVGVVEKVGGALFQTITNPG